MVLYLVSTESHSNYEVYGITDSREEAIEKIKGIFSLEWPDRPSQNDDIRAEIWDGFRRVGEISFGKDGELVEKKW